MSALNQRLQDTFLFSNADLRANHAGRLSQRQLARLRAAGGSQRLAMMIFAVVLLGSLAVIVIGSLVSRSNIGLTPAQMFVQLAIIAGVVGVVGVVFLVGFLASRPYMTKSSPRRMLMAQGPAALGKIKPDEARFEIKIGAAALRLLTDEQLAAFQPGTAYRVFYLPGPVPTLLSAEVIGTEAEADDGVAEPVDLTHDPVLKMQSRARPILIVLAVLTLAIPLIGILGAYLFPGARWLVLAGLLAVGVGFAFWAIRRLS